MVHLAARLIRKHLYGQFTIKQKTNLTFDMLIYVAHRIVAMASSFRLMAHININYYDIFAPLQTSLRIAPKKKNNKNRNFRISFVDEVGRNETSWITTILPSLFSDMTSELTTSNRKWKKYFKSVCGCGGSELSMRRHNEMMLRKVVWKSPKRCVRTKWATN